MYLGSVFIQRDKFFGVFSSFTFNVITNTVGFKSNSLLFVTYVLFAPLLSSIYILAFHLISYLGFFNSLFFINCSRGLQYF